MSGRSGSCASIAVVPPVAGLAGLLATGGQTALQQVLSRLVHDLGLTSLVLRGDGPGAGDHGVLAVAGDVVHAVPLQRAVVRRGLPDVVHLPVRAGGRLLAVLVVVGVRPGVLPALSEAVDVLALALLALRQPAPHLGSDAVDALAEADAELDALADAFHDGPLQAVVAARWAADAAVRGGDPLAVRTAVHDALVALRRSLWQLRPRGAGGLGEALASLSRRLVECGRPPLDLQLDPVAESRLTPAESVLAYRLVQDAVRPGSELPVRVLLPPSAAALTVSGEGLLPAADRWAVRARVLGATVQAGPHQVRLVLAPRSAVTRGAGQPPAPALSAVHAPGPAPQGGAGARPLDGPVSPVSAPRPLLAPLPSPVPRPDLAGPDQKAVL
jgi:hypothetical protein